MKNKLKQILKWITVTMLILSLLITTETIVLAEEIKEQTEEALTQYQEEKRTQDLREKQRQYIEENQAVPAEIVEKTESAASSDQSAEGEEEIIISQPELETDAPELYEQLYGEPVEVYEYGKVYRTDTNTYKFIGTSEPCMYEDEKGELQEIDNTLVEEETPGFRLFSVGSTDTTCYTNAGGSNDVKLPVKMQEGRGLTLTNQEGKTLELFPHEGTYENVSVLGNAILYNEVFENVDVNTRSKETASKKISY